MRFCEQPAGFEPHDFPVLGSFEPVPFFNRAGARKKRHSLSRKKIDENKGPVLLVIHSQQTGALFTLPSAEKGHKPWMPSQTISSAQPFFPFGKSSWAFCVSRRKTEKGEKKMIIEVTQETTTTRWQDIPIPIRCKNCPYPLCRLHLPGPGWRLPVGRRGAARRKAPD